MTASTTNISIWSNTETGDRSIPLPDEVDRFQALCEQAIGKMRTNFGKIISGVLGSYTSYFTLQESLQAASREEYLKAVTLSALGTLQMIGVLLAFDSARQPEVDMKKLLAIVNPDDNLFFGWFMREFRSTAKEVFEKTLGGRGDWKVLVDHHVNSGIQTAEAMKLKQLSLTN